MSATIIDFGKRLATKRALERDQSEQAALAQGIPGTVQARIVPHWNDMEVYARIERLNQLLADWRKFKGAQI